MESEINTTIFFTNPHIIVIILLKKKFGFILFLPSKGQIRKWNKFKSNLFIFNFNQKRSRESATLAGQVSFSYILLLSWL